MRFAVATTERWKSFLGEIILFHDGGVGPGELKAWAAVAAVALAIESVALAFGSGMLAPGLVDVTVFEGLAADVLDRKSVV